MLSLEINEKVRRYQVIRYYFKKITIELGGVRRTTFRVNGMVFAKLSVNVHVASSSDGLHYQQWSTQTTNHNHFCLYFRSCCRKAESRWVRDTVKIGSISTRITKLQDEEKTITKDAQVVTQNILSFTLVLETPSSSNGNSSITKATRIAPSQPIRHHNIESIFYSLFY